MVVVSPLAMLMTVFRSAWGIRAMVELGERGGVGVGVSLGDSLDMLMDVSDKVGVNYEL